MAIVTSGLKGANGMVGYRREVACPVAVWNGGTPVRVRRSGHTVRTLHGKHRTFARADEETARTHKSSNENMVGAHTSSVSSLTAKMRDMGIGLLFGLVLIGSLFIGSGEQTPNNDIAQLETALVAQ
ncbi:hypothetical protein [Corynebacterium glucuronolyticum]|uniref:hypothetical protein n=1 Tax=Corynebacterium glucuronolyticum TaxID=39791 RepID=UPI00223BA64C|nr:hypothetical protein [Corynebacterium glucuronolyticum]MCT1564479.1 hypothetical protein [Corynebacterium glucuronolyticum]